VNRVLIFHTAFPGDIILTLPLAQKLRAMFPDVRISMLTIPPASDLLRNHPAIDDRIVYDKKGTQRGLGAIMDLARDLRRRGFDVVLIPHRSVRSAVVCRLAGIPVRVGFSTSAGRLFLTETVPDDRGVHEILRNLSLLRPMGVAATEVELPRIYPDEADRSAVSRFLAGYPGLDSRSLVAVAPGSVWNTKRWPSEYFAALVRLLCERGVSPVLVGGEEDRELGRCIVAAAGTGRVVDATGRFSLLGSAELIRRCRVCVSNDSAPMHLAVAIGTPVVALFGATVPEFGFGPLGADNAVVQTPGLPCRPCSIHGGVTCPIKTFECMHRITPAHVLAEVLPRIT
jgi:heptosyltransferase II